MNNYLKIFSIFFLSVGIFFSVGLFALKILFQKTNNSELIVLGPDNEKIITKPRDSGGEKVSNLDIEILNDKDALILNEKIRPRPTKPELLPLEVLKVPKIDESQITLDSHILVQVSTSCAFKKSLTESPFFK